MIFLTFRNLRVIASFLLTLILDSHALASPSHSLADHKIIDLQAAQFDPAKVTPASLNIPTILQADAHSSLFIVQYTSKTRFHYRENIERPNNELLSAIKNHLPTKKFSGTLGLRSRNLGKNADLYYLPEGLTKKAIEHLYFVRSVTPFHPAFKLPPEWVDRFRTERSFFIPANKEYALSLTRKSERSALIQLIQNIGGEIQAAAVESSYIIATLTPNQLLKVLHSHYVVFVDPSPSGFFFDITPNETPSARDSTSRDFGADSVENFGINGEGLHACITDSGIDSFHPDYQHSLEVISNSALIDHGTKVFGLNISNGKHSNWTEAPGGRGILTGAFGHFTSVFNSTVNSDRHSHMATLANRECVYETNSWGQSLTRDYNVRSQEIDELVWKFRMSIFQMMGNYGGSNNVPGAAWNKNGISVGGVFHSGIRNRSQHSWRQGPFNSANHGPASDGRVKPDFTAYYDQVKTTAPGNELYYDEFGGTSAATPITAAHAGLVYNAWAKGDFGNPTSKYASVFEQRPAPSTIKALLVNSAAPYPMKPENNDLLRKHQGWGTVDIKRLYKKRSETFVVDEGAPITQDQVHQYSIVMRPGERELRVTLAYTDYPGTLALNHHQINDLHLRVTSPDGRKYWGNNGLLDSHESRPDGHPDQIDTIENVWIKKPAPGKWTIEVIGESITEDTHLTTQEIDSDYSLVVTPSILSARHR